MPTDLILDSLCAEGIARKTIRPMPSRTPSYPQKSLGSRYDTTFYNTVTHYTIELLIVKQDNTVTILKKGTGKPVEVSQSAKERLIAWFQRVISDGYTQKTGIVIYGIGSGGGGSPYRAEHITDHYDMSFLLGVGSALRRGLGGLRTIFDYFSAASDINDAVKYLIEANKPQPNVPGTGVLSPDARQAKLEELKKREEEKTAHEKPPYQRKEPITVPAKPQQFPAGPVHPSTNTTETQLLTVEVTLVPAETIHQANRDSASIKSLLKGVGDMMARDTIIEDKIQYGARILREKCTRQDTVLFIDTHLTERGMVFKDHITGETISKEKYEEIKRSE